MKIFGKEQRFGHALLCEIPNCDLDALKVTQDQARGVAETGPRSLQGIRKLLTVSAVSYLMMAGGILDIPVQTFQKIDVLLGSVCLDIIV